MAAPPIDAVRAFLGLAPLTASFPLSPEELSAKADAQARNSEGEFVEEADVKATMPGTEEATPSPPEPESLTGQEAVDALVSAGYDPARAARLSESRVYTNGGQAFVVAPTPKSDAARARDKAAKSLERAEDRYWGDDSEKNLASVQRARRKYDRAHAAHRSASAEVTPEQDRMAREALGYLETAVGKLSPRAASWEDGERKAFVASLDPAAVSPSVRKSASGEAYLGWDTMWVNPERFDQGLQNTGLLMPTSSFEKEGEYTINHELGHLIDHSTVGDRRAAYQRARGGLSRYGQESEIEAYAEAFTAWQDGDRGPLVTTYAEQFGWEAEEATPPPPEPLSPPPPEGGPETIPAGELLPDDVIEHEGQPITVTNVVTSNYATTITGETADGETVTVDLPADEPVALASEEPVEAPAKPEWRVRYDEARSKLPEDMSAFGVNTTPNPLLPRVRELLGENRRVRDAYVAGDRSEDTLSAVRASLHLGSDDPIPEDAVDQMNVAIDSLAMMEETMSDSRGVVDIGGDGAGNLTPGPIMQQHLDALLEMGAILDAELERRIQEALPDPRRSAVEAQAELDDARARLFDAMAANEAAVRAKREEVLAAEWPSLAAENPRRRAFGSADEVVAIATGLRRSTPARTELAADLYQRMEAAIAADEELAGHQQVLSDFYTEINRLDDEAGEARAAEHYGDPRGLHGTKAYAAVQREQAIALIAELREVGGSAQYATRVEDRVREDVHDSMKTAFASFPTEWVGDIDEQNIRIVMGRRGHYKADGGIDGRPHIMLSEESRSSALPPFSEVATHELGHAVEASRPHIRMAEWAYSHMRAPRATNEVEHVGWGSADEFAHFDRWAKPYTGRVYADSHYVSWEIMTTGLESLFTGSNYFFRQAEMGGFDAEFRAFILALLAEA